MSLHEKSVICELEEKRMHNEKDVHDYRAPIFYIFRYIYNFVIEVNYKGLLY